MTRRSDILMNVALTAVGISALATLAIAACRVTGAVLPIYPLMFIALGCGAVAIGMVLVDAWTSK